MKQFVAYLAAISVGYLVGLGTLFGYLWLVNQTGRDGLNWATSSLANLLFSALFWLPVLAVVCALPAAAALFIMRVVGLRSHLSYAAMGSMVPVAVIMAFGWRQGFMLYGVESGTLVFFAAFGGGLAGLAYARLARTQLEPPLES